MKTNVTLTRKMGEFDVLQRTSDGYFDANALLQQWNNTPGNPQRQMTRFLEQEQTKAFLEALREEISQSTEKYKPDIELFIKGKATTGKDGTRIAAKVWMHPYLFLKFAMWINPRFEVKVIKFVYDELIKYRNDAGDAYVEMSCAVSRITPKHFTQEAIRNVARAINYIVYNNHERGMRNKVGEEVKTRELFELERDISKLINGDFIKSYDELMNYLRKQWNKKWQPKFMQP